ncbi:PREDICTED: ell-associated factor Eaf isoform X2 [Wasmannia auropunctata]|uniref:ell-associated factor Eaf isoform X2 n=1 Tax=Wasmannia auropunctata TaxID=64793 RepID=UPI0005EE4BD3|nr:PREDICTED: ell-associated factor Eaf isoform X2 [Wasmannia auropunctata]
MQSASMVERLGLGAEVRELKLGPSFTSNSSKFHTLKYDFKPASVDDSKEARVDVGSDNTVTVTVPHLDGAGTPHTVFKGSQRPYNKEYVLVIDKATGEVTLEKLSANIQVKKTRSSPVQSSSGAPTLASLPLIGSDNDDFAPSASMPGSSSAQTVAQSASISNTKSTTLESDSSSSSSSSDSSSSDYETENVSVPTAINGNLNGTTASPTLFAADNLLNDDLQLSESESDSD